MAVSHGMDVGEVRRLGGSLQTSAGAIDNLITRIESAMSGSTWVGPDASRFTNQWWPEHRVRLKHMSETLHGLGQSALNNAKEQEQASGVASGVAGGGVPLTTFAFVPALWITRPSFIRPFFERWFDRWFGQKEESPWPRSPWPREPGPLPGAVPFLLEKSDSQEEDGSMFANVGATSGELAGSNRSWQEIQKLYEKNDLGIPSDKAIGGINEYQCTSWAEFRWREIAEEKGIDIQIKGGDGYIKAERNDGSVGNPPTLGAMASAGDGVTLGHVMIVEEIGEAPGGLQKIRVSEMNTGDNGPYITDANEYRSDRWITQQPDGTWVSEGTQMTFADLPGS